ncbi:hypothetical protein V8E55_001263 [Tylopilus felleus]
MPRAISPDLKTHIPRLYHDGHSIKDICTILGLKKSLVYKTLDLYARFGTVTNPYKYSQVVGRRRILNSADLCFIRTVIQHRSTIYLDELQHELWAKCCKYAISLPFSEQSSIFS